MRIWDWSSDVCASDLPGPDLASLRIRPADRLLVAGGPREVEALRDNPHLSGADLAKVRAFRRGKAWIAILCMIAVVALAALDVLSIGVAAIIAIGVILVTRCIDSEEAWGTKIGRASCRERVCQYVSISVVAVSFQKKQQLRGQHIPHMHITPHTDP